MPLSYRALPDPDISLRDAADFIANSELGRKALECRDIPRLPIFIRDIIATVHRLTISCHLPEFTDHGLRHLCSMVDRISRWTCAPTENEPEALCNRLAPQQACMLLIAVLLHDMGMLSQRPEDVPPEAAGRLAKGQMDIATWVRRTHVSRLDGLVQRLFGVEEVGGYADVLALPLIQRAKAIARAHEKWPWESGFCDLPDVDPALAAVLAVSDLLDEDASRCDAETMISHRQGSMLNYAHWMRHCLTTGRVSVEAGHVEVSLARPPHTDAQIAPVFSALRNHYRLVMLYCPQLSMLGAGLVGIRFSHDAIPQVTCPELDRWRDIPGITTQRALVYRLLTSFFPEALLDSQKVTPEFSSRISGLEMEQIDLGLLTRVQGELEVRSPYELMHRSALDGVV